MLDLFRFRCGGRTYIYIYGREKGMIEVLKRDQVVTQESSKISFVHG